MNVLRQAKIVLYRLKMNFGVPVNIIVDLGTIHDIQTGRIVANERSFIIRRAMVLPDKMVRDFVYDLSFIAANKNFTYGGLFDKSTRLMILDSADLPRDYIPAIDNRCVYANERYNFKDMNRLIENLGYLITLEQAHSQITENVLTLPVDQEAVIGGESNVE